MHANVRGIFEAYAKDYFTSDKVVLEIGAIHPSVWDAPSSRWDFTDIKDDPNNTFKCGAYTIPVEDNSYDIILSADVLEHVAMPWVWLPELVRVCKPDGYVITMAPCNWPYHPDPIDCWRVYPDGIKALYEYSGLKIEQCIAQYGNLIGDEQELFGHAHALTLDVIAIGRK